MSDLLLRIDTAHGRRAGLEQALREAVRDGQLPAGTLLPSTRVLAADLGLGRATVVAAYEQLVVEGYLLATQGAGTRVADLRIPQPAVAPADQPRPAGVLVDFRPGEPDGGLFPRTVWARAVRRVLTEISDSAFGYADPGGVAELRSALAQYLGRSRAVFSDASGVRVFGGVASSFGFLGEAFRAMGITRLAVEDPSLFVLRDVFPLVGIDLVPVPVDEDGLSVEHLDGLDVGAVLVTPGHQFPLGVTMSPARRSDLVAWAQDREAWIVEDDYDGEFRYDRRPIGAVQGLDPDRVIYAGTASKALSPGLRLSWLVVPPRLRNHLSRVTHLRAGVSTIDQLALADLIDRGDLDRHLRRSRTLYGNRHQRVSEVLGRHPWLHTSPSDAGLHLTVTTDPDIIEEADLVDQASQHGISLLGLDPMWLGEPQTQGVIIGYSRPAQHQFGAGLDRLAHFLESQLVADIVR